MNILITGGAGFVGSHLTDKLLSLGKKVVVVDKSKHNIEKNLKDHHNLKVYEMSILSPEIPYIMEKEKIDYVVHAAAIADIVPSIENPLEYHANNVDGTMMMLEASRMRRVKKFIYIASGSCYGDDPPIPTLEIAKIK